MTDLQVKYHDLQERKRHQAIEESLKGREAAVAEGDLAVKRKKSGPEMVETTTRASRNVTGMFSDLSKGLKDVVGAASIIGAMLG